MKLTTIDKTPFGSVVLAWRESDGPVITHILISSESRSAKQRAAELYPGAKNAACNEIDLLAGRLTAFLEGRNVKFSLDRLDLDRCGPFHQRVLRATHGIPRGQVATYGGLAAHLGQPGGARAAGNAMARNPFPLIVPCHRVVRADLMLGAYGGGVEMKRGLLALEGIVPDDRGKIARAQVKFAR